MKNLSKAAVFATLCAMTAPNSIFAMPNPAERGSITTNALTANNEAKITIQGTVVDESGAPVIGANVIIAGTTRGVVTNIDGQFNLPDVEAGATLVVSYIGYQEIKIKAESNMNIVLKEDAELLDEVVVVGYGTMRRKDVTSSISTVQAKELNQGVYTDPAQLLQGKVAGLTITQTSDPNQSSSITLRGASTLREGEAMEPYYIIDGVPGVDLSFVSPDDIESIDVLRDATATAIYGSKAANGVIIITTKRGKDGRVNINYNGYVAFDKVNKNMEMMSASDLRNYAAANDFTLPNDEGADTNWQDEVQRLGISHNHNLAVSGGNERSNYNVSLNYLNREGVILGSGMERFNARALAQSKVLKDHLTLSLGVNASQSTHNESGGNNASQSEEERGSQNVIDAMLYYSPTQPIRNEDMRQPGEDAWEEEGTSYAGGDGGLLEQIKMTDRAYCYGKLNVNMLSNNTSLNPDYTDKDDEMGSALFYNIYRGQSIGDLFGDTFPGEEQPIPGTPISRTDATNSAVVDAMKQAVDKFSAAYPNYKDQFENRAQFLAWKTDDGKCLANGFGIATDYDSLPDAQREELVGKTINLIKGNNSVSNMIRFIVVAQTIRDMDGTIARIRYDGTVKTKDCKYGTFDVDDDGSSFPADFPENDKYLYFDEITGEVKLLVTMENNPSTGQIIVRQIEYID